MRTEYENIAKNTKCRTNKLNSCMYKEQTGFTLVCFFSPIPLHVLGHMARESCFPFVVPAQAPSSVRSLVQVKCCRTGLTVLSVTAGQRPIFVHETKDIDFPERNIFLCIEIMTTVCY